MSVGHPNDGTDEQMQHSACVQSSAPEVRPKADNQSLSAAGPSPVVEPVDLPEVVLVETMQLSSPPRSGQRSTESPQTIAFEDMGDSSVPLSRFSGHRLLFAQYTMIPGSDAPLTLPVYTMPFASPMDTEDSPLVTTGLPGCPYRIMAYNGPVLSDMNPAFGLQLHHPRFLEFIGAPDSAWLLYHSPSFWVDRLGEECVMAAAVNLQFSQFDTSLHRMSSEMMSNGIGRAVFPAADIADLSSAPRAPRAAKYMAAMGLWRPQTGPGDLRPVPASSCNICMKCQYCFPGGRLPPE